MSMPKDNEIDYNISEWKRIGEERGYFKYFEKALQQQKHKIEEWVKENAMPPKDAGFEIIKCADKDCFEVSVEKGDFCRFHNDNLPF